MGRAPCCAKVGLKTGRWTAEEDEILIKYIKQHGEGAWRSLPENAGLLRCGKSCRLRWTNYLRSDVKRGNITKEEEDIIVNLHASIGNKWSLIASQLPGRTDNEIKNYWNSHLSRRIDTFRRRNNGEASVPIIINLKQLDKKTTPPKRKGGRTSRSDVMKKKKVFNNVVEATKLKLEESVAFSSANKDETRLIITTRANNGQTTQQLPETTTLESFVVDDNAMDSCRSQDVEEECGVNKNLMLCPAASADDDDESGKSGFDEIFGPHDHELGNNNDFLMITSSSSFGNVLDYSTELFLNPNNNPANGLGAGLSQQGNNNTIGECCSDSSSTMASSDEAAMIGDWDWDWENIVQEMMNIDNQEEEEEVLTSLWESSNKDSHCGGEIIDYEKQKADIVAWLLS